MADTSRVRRIVAEYLRCGSKSEVAHVVGCDRGTVRKVIRQWEAGDYIGIEGFPMPYGTVSKNVPKDESHDDQVIVVGSAARIADPVVSGAPAAPAVVDVLPERSHVADRQKLRLEAELSAVKGKYREALGDLAEVEAQRDAMLAIAEPVKPLAITADPSNTKGEAVAIWQASDWHVEERVDASTVNHVNEYNPDVAERRAKAFFRNGLKLVRKERQDVVIDTLILHLGGDLITGYIHEELEESNYLSPIEAVMFVKRLIIGGLELLKTAGEFKQVQVITSWGNHGRTTKKIRVSTGHKNSYEWLLYNDLASQFANDPIIKFHVGNSYFTYVEIYGHLTRWHHGDAVKYGGGIGGLMVPLLRYISKANQQRPAVADFIGHFHNRIPYSPATRAAVNGSLIGFNAYAQRIGASPEPPVQNFQLLDSRYGFTIASPIIVEDGK